MRSCATPEPAHRQTNVAGATRPKLTIGFSTLDERYRNITLPPARSDREILIIVQHSGDQPMGDVLAALGAAGRGDIRVLELRSKGVAKSRNVALREAAGEYLIFADDDIVFSDAGLDEVCAYLDSNPGCDFVLGQATDPAGVLRKKYASRPERLGLFNSAKAATYEMVVRVDASRRKNVWFDENFGAGAVNYLGDEYIFIVDLVRAGSLAMFLPITLAAHPVESSGSRWGTDADLKARAVIFSRVFGWAAPFVRLAFGFRHWGRKGDLRRWAKFVRR